MALKIVSTMKNCSDKNILFKCLPKLKNNIRLRKNHLTR